MANPIPTASPASTIPTPLALKAAAEQATLDRMALAAHAVLATDGEPPVRVLLGIVDSRQAEGSRTGTRYAPADPEHGQPLPTVVVDVGRNRTGSPETVAAAVAIGLVNLRTPGRAKERVAMRKLQLFGMGLAKRPAADTVDAVLADKGRADTVPFSRAIAAARKAQGADAEPTGGATLAPIPEGKRFVLSSDEVRYDPLTGEKIVRAKTLEIRPAVLVPKTDTGKLMQLVLMPGDAPLPKGATMLGIGTLVHQRKQMAKPGRSAWASAE